MRAGAFDREEPAFSPGKRVAKLYSLSVVDHYHGKIPGAVEDMS